MDSKQIIEHNIKAHDKIFNKYEKNHGEIYNDVEQERLDQQLGEAISKIKTAKSVKKALDYGCGSGNLTRHLLGFGLNVMSADISENFLSLIKQRYEKTGRIKTLKINGFDLAAIADNSFDFVGTYSVLHHIPDYISAVKEMIRVVNRGGIIYLDHEASESYWNKTAAYLQFVNLTKWTEFEKYLKPLNYINKIHRIINPNFSPEGDIHVTDQDHIEWKNIESLLANNGCEILLKKEYLLFKRNYPLGIYQEYKNKCNDICVLVARKK
jgi:ubiquinone/menaquinone biosynthesis C-methylase UbiE